MGYKRYKELFKFAKDSYREVPIYFDLKEKNGINIDELEENDEGWGKIPVISKKNLLGKGEKCIAAPHVMDVINGDNIIHISSSSSSGSCLYVCWDEDDIKQSFLETEKLRKMYYDIDNESRFCYFYDGHCIDEEVENETLFYKSNETMICFSKLSLSEKNILEIYKKINEFKPKWMLVESTIALILARCYHKHNMGLIDCLEYIEITGAVVSEEEKELIRKTFGCKVGFQFFYSEVNVVAFECPCGNLHCTDDIFIEVESDNDSDDNKEGNFCVTSLRNKVTPFIRYRLNEKGSLIKGSSCQCGNRHPILNITDTIHNDMPINLRGMHVNTSSFIDAIEATNSNCDNEILQFQIVQSSEDTILVYLVLEKTVSNNKEQRQRIIDLFLHSYHEPLMYGFNFDFVFVDHIDKDNNFIYSVEENKEISEEKDIVVANDVNSKEIVTNEKSENIITPDCTYNIDELRSILSDVLSKKEFMPTDIQPMIVKEKYVYNKLIVALCMMVIVGSALFSMINYSKIVNKTNEVYQLLQDKDNNIETSNQNVSGNNNINYNEISGKEKTEVIDMLLKKYPEKKIEISYTYSELISKNHVIDIYPESENDIENSESIIVVISKGRSSN